MNILQMSAQVSTLSEGFLTKSTFKWSLTSMFPKVISQVAAFLEGTITPNELALED